MQMYQHGILMERYKMKKHYICMLFICLLLVSCSGDDVGDGSVCAVCETDADCNEGLVCVGFYNSSGVYMRCSEQSCGIFGCVPSTTQC